MFMLFMGVIGSYKVVVKISVEKVVPHIPYDIYKRNRNSPPHTHFFFFFKRFG